MLQLAVAFLLLGAQDAPPKVDPKKVDAAIDKGAKALLRDVKRGVMALPHPTHGAMSRDELVLYTLIHAGVDANDETFKSLVARVLKNELKHVYSVALMAMALEALDRRAHQSRIAECAQFLVDNQCANGQWSYGSPVPADRKTATPGSKPAPKSGSTEALPTITIARRGRGPATGDNSNSQYAALGLRACLESGVRIPQDVLADAEKWWEQSQRKDGGWGYDISPVAVDESYGSMTAGAVGSLVICKHYLKEEFTKARSVQAGLKWLASNFSVTENPRAPQESRTMWHYYWLYALERAGLLYGTETMGAHEWYPEGAEFLLAKQRANGTWSGDSLMSLLPDAGPDTCFAILFLRRATKPVRDVASVDPRKK